MRTLNLVASSLENFSMEAQPSVSLGARRNEDIALDLLKFVAATAGVGRTAVPATGFSGASAPKTEEQVNQLLELYSRCLKAVEGQGPEREQAGQGPEPEQAGKGPEPEQAGKGPEPDKAGQGPVQESKGPEQASRAPQGGTPQQ
jgi:hypothetical protein